MSRGVCIVVTGTDTSVGKTVLTALLARRLTERGPRVAAFKPLASGDREDARTLRAAIGNALSLDQVNPWHFRTPLAPLLAARLEGERVELADVVRHVRAVARGHDVVLVEGAGGLLSPMGEGFDTRDMITGLRARPVVVCPNRLGAVNQALLVLRALPRVAARQAQVVLVTQPRTDLSSHGNPALLAEFVAARQIHLLPRLPPAILRGDRALPPGVITMLDALLDRLLPRA